MWLDPHSNWFQSRSFHTSIPATCTNNPRSISSVFSSPPSFFLAQFPGIILYLPVVFAFDGFDFGIASDVDLTRFFTLTLYLFVFFGLTNLLVGTLLQNNLAMGFLPTAASAFTCAIFFGCFLIPPDLDLPIVELVLVASLWLVTTKNSCKIKASLHNEGAKSSVQNKDKKPIQK